MYFSWSMTLKIVEAIHAYFRIMEETYFPQPQCKPTSSASSIAIINATNGEHSPSLDFENATTILLVQLEVIQPKQFRFKVLSPFQKNLA